MEFAELQAVLKRHSSIRAILYAFNLLFLKCAAYARRHCLDWRRRAVIERGAVANLKFVGGRLGYLGGVRTGFSEAVAKLCVSGWTAVGRQDDMVERYEGRRLRLLKVLGA